MWGFATFAVQFFLMQQVLSAITQVIRGRRSVFPREYTSEPISRSILDDIIENANYAPTHRLTEPWRFVVFESAEARTALGTYLAEEYKRRTPPERYTEETYIKTQRNPELAACVMAICMQRDLLERIPEWEELASTAMSVQNMWLTAHAHGVGAYWSSPKSMLEANVFLNLKEGEQCLGLFFLGHHASEPKQAKRTPMTDKVTWR